MESESESPEFSFLERLISSRNRDLSIFLPILLGLTNSDSSQPDPESSSRGRIILINPMTQGMVVIEGTFSRIDSLFRDLLINKQGQPPASKLSIDAMPSVEICDGERGDGCVICLDEWEIGVKGKEMPCKHRFHGECIEKWLGIHGSCPVCRYKMPVENDDDGGKKVDEDDDVDEGDEEEEESMRRRRREIWVNFSFNRDRRNDDSDSNSDSNSDSDQTVSSSSSADQSSSE